ncbi:hypothetical protein SAMN04515654_1153 [Halanaerobium congolense]|uniref:Uncharacterized protein n=1 Tax=Halanaerobium congolense TaxID=54121 RepID=A0A1G8NFB0_9FIRM|nr:hypothetical protein [Halanaerobium congolense]OEG62156.1 MAG: hypothetical protein BHK79_07175 [Halanaerobium sp. MDAL1]SDI78939.1 hypothetical protein SAMN04515654_1153 [Halanaerobium congolense]SET48461.1 hypothetical protein SAMN04515653_1163 [Halanaerobium congolense]
MDIHEMNRKAKENIDKTNKKEKIKRKLGINSWSEVDEPEKLLEFLLQTEKLDNEIVLEILDQIPNVLELSKELTDKITKVGEFKKETTEHYLYALNNISDHLGRFLDRDDLTEEERRYAMDNLMKLAEIMREMAKEDTEFFEKVLKVLGWMGLAIVGTLAAIFGIDRFGNNSNDKIDKN